ncbi:DNA cytosine methyltransferase [Janthinobacterium sp. DSP2-3-3]|uniref:DNA cytosine methyltransferase n=1 Tax=Janthinobacterium sp. DSP2-3-3 TaxID=2804596 RepID=UPI003CEA1A1A
MRRDNFTLSLDLGSELIIDNFAGGGGTSTGLEQAFGRPVDIAINHDPEALAMHAANHPHTTHLCESVWDVDPIKVTNNRPVGLVWLSPDCKHFSKAKGGKPVEKRIRGLAWVTLRWAAKCKPRVIMLENVEEFKTWGPLLVEADGTAKPDPAKKGKTFDSFIRQLRAHGYAVDYREMRGCDHDTPTIRKRFFLVARRDGIAIKWPEPTHGAPDSIGVRAGRLLPYRTAAECIDFSIPCPSIFTRDRPLAPATLRRIAKGIMRYVVDAEDPFIVNTANSKTTGRAPNVWERAEPLRTITSAPGFAVVAPTIVPVTHQGSDRSESIGEPFRTITGAHRGEKALGVATLVQVGYGERPALYRCKECGNSFNDQHATGVGGLAPAECPCCGEEERIDLVHAAQVPRALDIEKPLGTVVGESKHALVSALLSGVGGRAGQSRPRGVDEPTATATSKADAALVTAFLTEHANASNQRVMPADEPLRTICAQVKGGHFSMVSAHITKFRTGATGSAMTEPVPTITAGPKEKPAGAPHALGIVTAHIEALYTQKGDESRASPAGEPIKTVTATSRHALLTSNLIKLRGTSTAAGTDEPLGTVSAGGQHHAEVRAFLLSYYGTDQAPEIDGPLATVTSRDRFGLVTIRGQDYQIVDIGLRMLQPRELFRAQGFPDDYIIGDDPAQGLKLTKSAQVRMCGNSVCPPMAKALILANFAHEGEIARVA